VSRIDRYVLIGLSIIFIIITFAYFSDGSNVEYDYEGFVFDIKETKNGCIFNIESDDMIIHCYYSEIPIEFGFYAINGNYSDDNTIFFIESMFLKE